MLGVFFATKKKVEQAGGRLDHQSLKLVIEDKDQCTTSATQDVGKSSLEESLATFSLVDLAPAVQGVLVHDVALGAARLHHHTTTDSVEGVGDDTRSGRHNLGDHPLDEERCLLGVGQHTAGRVIKTEISGTVDDDALYGHVESTVQTDNTVRLEGLGQAVYQTVVLTLSSSLTNISTQSVIRKRNRYRSQKPEKPYCTLSYLVRAKSKG